MVVDGVIFTSQTTSGQDAGDYYNAVHNGDFILDIGSVSSDIANGKLASWNTSKHIKLQVGSGIRNIIQYYKTTKLSSRHDHRY